MTRKNLLATLAQKSKGSSFQMIREGFNGYTTQYLSEASRIDRSNVSRALNELF